MIDIEEIKDEPECGAEAEQTEPENAEAAEAEMNDGKPEAAEGNGEAGEDSSENAEDTAEVQNGEAGENGSEKKETSKPDPKDLKIEELSDKYRRLFAEFDNFRKRTDNEKAGMFADGQKAVLLKILPLIDNFERAQSSVPEELKGSGYAEGMEKTYRSFLGLLNELGVTQIEAVGQPFNADLHNAVMHIEDESLGENVVAEEFQKGYMFKGKVLRYSMVKVAN